MYACGRLPVPAQMLALGNGTLGILRPLPQRGCCFAASWVFLTTPGAWGFLPEPTTGRSMGRRKIILQTLVGVVAGRPFGT